MSEAVTENKTLLKQAQENLKKAKETRRNEKVLAEFGQRSKQLLEAAKVGECSIQFVVSLTEAEALELQGLFLEEGLTVSVYYYTGGYYDTYCSSLFSGFINALNLNSPKKYSFVLTIPSA